MRHSPTLGACMAGVALLVCLGVFLHQGESARAEAPLYPASADRHHVARLSLRVEGSGGPVRLELPLPPSDRHQRISGESFNLRGFSMEEVEREGNRLAILEHPGFSGRKRITYEFHVQSVSSSTDFPQRPPSRGGPHREDWPWLRPTLRIQSASPLLLERFGAFARARMAQGERDAIQLAWEFASTSFERRADGSKGMLKALRTGHASDLGLERIFIASLRASGVPARPVHGLDLRPSSKASSVSWAEVKTGGKWVPMSVGEGTMGILPAHRIKLSHGDRPFVAREGVRSLRYRWRISELAEETQR